MAQAKADVRAEFAEALHRAGLRPKGIPIMDGRKHRVVVEGDRSGRKSGTYIGHLDERPAGYIHNFKTGERSAGNRRGNTQPWRRRSGRD